LNHSNNGHKILSAKSALYLARGDPRIPWHAKAVIVLTVAFAISLMPDNVLEEYRECAKTKISNERISSWAGLLIIALLWLLVLYLVVKFVFRII
jgi:hypothetical protein